MIRNQYIKALIALIVVLFIVFYLMLGYYNRPAGDDLMHMSTLKDFGWFEALFQFKWNIRWASYPLLNTLFSLGNPLSEGSLILFFYHAVTLFMLIWGFAHLIDSVCRMLKIDSISQRDKWLYGGLTTVALFYASSQHIETWFWISGTFTFLWSMVFTMFGVSHLLRPPSPARLPLIVLCSLGIGGTLETMALLVVAGLLITIRRMAKSGKNLQELYHFIIGLICILITLSPAFVGTGVKDRLQEEAATILPIYESFTIDTVKYELSRIIDQLTQARTLVFVALLIPWLWVGKQLDLSFIEAKSLIKKSLIVMALAMAITLAPNIYIFNSLGPERTWFPISVVVMVLCIMWVLVLGSRISNTKMVKSAALIGSLAAAVAIIFYTVRQQEMVATYANAFDQRIEFLREFKPANGVGRVVLDPLPDSGMLLKSELKTNPAHTYNRAMVNLLDLDYEVVGNAL